MLDTNGRACALLPALSLQTKLQWPRKKCLLPLASLKEITGKNQAPGLKLLSPLPLRMDLDIRQLGHTISLVLVS